VADEDLEASMIRALGDTDMTSQRMAAVQAHKVLPSSPQLLAALEPLLASQDPSLRRAAAASYVEFHPNGAQAPRLRPLHADAVDVVVQTATGMLREPRRESAYLQGLMRSVARTQAAGYGASVARLHEALWQYSPNPRAAEIMKVVTVDELDRDAVALRETLRAMLRDSPPSPRVAQLMFYLPSEDELELQYFIAGRYSSDVDAAIELVAFPKLGAFKWELHDDPWSWFFRGGCFALAIAHVLGELRLDDTEREVATCCSCGGEQLQLGVIRKTGVTFLSRAEALTAELAARRS